MKKFLKGLLLYVTIIYFILFIIGVESIMQIPVLNAILTFILIALCTGCFVVFISEDLKEYIPKKIRKWFDC